MSSSQSSQFPPKSIVKNKSYEGVEALRQIASTSLFLDNEQKINGQTIPTIKEPDEGKKGIRYLCREYLTLHKFTF